MPNPIIVVGGGLAGLCSAILLRRAGHRVVVLERSSELGGRARSPLLGAVPLNLGAHALYRGGAAERVLRSVGVVPEGLAPPIDGMVMTLEGNVLPAPNNPLSILWSAFLPWSAKAELVKWLGGIGRHAARASDSESWASWLGRVQHEEVRLMLSMVARVSTYANAAQHVSAKAVLTQVASAVTKSVIYPTKGWQAFVDDTEAEAKRVGVEVRTSCPVMAVEDGGRRVRLDGEVLAAEATVLAIPLAAAVTLTRHEGLQALADRATISRVATLDLVLSKLPAPTRRNAQGLDEPTYFSVHSTPGAQLIKAHAHWVLAAEEKGAVVRERLEAWLERVQPGWRACVVAERYLPELRVADALPTVGDVRPGVQVAEHLFAAAEWAERGWLLDASLAAVESVVQRLANRAARAA